MHIHININIYIYIQTQYITCNWPVSPAPEHMWHALINTPNNRQTERAGKKTNMAIKNLMDFLTIHWPTDAAVHQDLSGYV